MHDGVAALLFYILVYGMMNLGAFAAIAMLKVKGREAETLDDLAGVSRKQPWTALGLAVCVFSLMGFPPTAGFLGKVYVFSSALSLPVFHPFRGALVVLTVIAVLNSAVGAAYYLRIAGACYLREPEVDWQRVGGWTARMGLAACSVAMLALFLTPQAVVRQAKLALGGVDAYKEKPTITLEIRNPDDTVTRVSP